jgi:hypothetical protein
MMNRFPIGFWVLWMACTMVLIGGPADARVYKWVDENGVTRFSDRPPPGVQAAMPPSDSAEPDKASRPDALTSIATNLNFDLSGEVRDGRGNPINGVAMTIIENHPVPGTFEFKRKRRKETIDGRFHIVCDKCPIHTLKFRAPGFLSETYDIKPTPAEENHLTQQAMAAMTGKPNAYTNMPLTIVRDNIVIVLEPESSVVRLTRIEGRLGTVDEGPLSVISGRPPAVRQNPARAFMKADTTPEAGEAIIALVTGDLPFAYFADAGAENTLHTLDTPLYIELAGVDGGFVPAESQPGTLRERWDSLKEAPEANYQKRFPAQTSTKYTPWQFFYFKVGSFYGKGRVGPVFFRTANGHGMLDASIELYLNPSGSRDLASRFR